MDMFGKLNELKNQTDEMKKRLSSITVEQDFDYKFCAKLS